MNTTAYNWINDIPGIHFIGTINVQTQTLLMN
jgi:hypothetical protein